MKYDKALELVREWQWFWMNQNQNDKRDHERYRNAAFNIDANMKHHLARKIAQAVKSGDLIENES